MSRTAMHKNRHSDEEQTRGCYAGQDQCSGMGRLERVGGQQQPGWGLVR